MPKIIKVGGNLAKLCQTILFFFQTRCTKSAFHKVEYSNSIKVMWSKLQSFVSSFFLKLFAKNY